MDISNKKLRSVIVSKIHYLNKIFDVHPLRSKAQMVEEIWQFKVFQKKLPENKEKWYLATLMTWVDLHWGAVQIKTQFQASREAQ